MFLLFCFVVHEQAGWQEVQLGSHGQRYERAPVVAVVFYVTLSGELPQMGGVRRQQVQEVHKIRSSCG